ncbi:MAG: hypothetical protein ACRDXX_21390 [Stackebrandtia sp.]
MYGWIWRKLPFGLPGKIAGSVLLLVGAVALLWFAVFPAIQPYMPFNNSVVDGDGGGDGGGEDDPGRVPSYDPSDYELEESPEESAGDGSEGE